MENASRNLIVLRKLLIDWKVCEAIAIQIANIEN
jgi:hypothetical protein